MKDAAWRILGSRGPAAQVRKEFKVVTKGTKLEAKGNRLGLDLGLTWEEKLGPAEGDSGVMHWGGRNPCSPCGLFLQNLGSGRGKRKRPGAAGERREERVGMVCVHFMFFGK